MSTRLLQSLFFLILTSNSPAQDVKYLVTEGEQLQKAMKDEEALKKFQEALRIAPADLSALVKASESNSIIGNRQSDTKRKREYFTAARTYAESALKADSSHAGANYAMAMAMGRMALISSGKEKVQYVRDIKTHADACLKADPNHARGLHILGKWHSEVTNLNFAEKAALKVLYGGLPPSSYAEAIKAYEKARSVDPTFVLNYLELARAYRANGQSDKAIEVLTRMQRLPPKSADDPGYKAEGKKLLESLL
jgi:tetratricopeptide (TPR) repeat protein